MAYRRKYKRGRKSFKIKRSIKRSIAKAKRWARGKNRARILKAYLAKVGKSKYNKWKR